MHSLKELRAQNAAREELSRTAASAGTGRLSEPTRNPLATTAPESGAISTATTTSRAGRTLAPLVRSAESPAGGAGRGGGRDTRVQGTAEQRNSNGTEVDPHTTTRQWQKKDKAQYQNNTEENEATSAVPASAASRTTTGEGDKEAAAESGGIVATGAIAKGDAADDKQSQRQQDQHAVVGREPHSEEGALARGAPPQQKPKKKLTPLAARRARIEQQRREEAERKMNSPQKAAKAITSSHPTTTTTEGVPNNAPLGDSTTATAGVTTPSTDDELLPDSPGSSTEQDRLMPVRRDDQEGASQSKGGEGSASSGPAISGDPDVGATEGRFSGMRSRMKKAGQGLKMKPPSPTTSQRDTAEGRKAGGTWSNGRFQINRGRPAAASAAKDGDAAGDGVASDGKTAEEHAMGGETSQRHEDEENSDAASDDSGTSSAVEKAASENTDGDESSGSRGKGQKNLWRKANSSTEAGAAADREVTLGHVVDRKMREMGYIRKPAVDELKNRRSLRERVAAERAPEVHFIGEIIGAEGFGSGISCRFRVEGGRHWTCLAGLEEGQTHVVYVDNGESFAVWNHPVDLHYTTKSIQGWPRLMVQVWQLDMHGRNVLRGYGFRHLPPTTGFSEMSVPCWRPTGTVQEETASFFLGVTPRLTAEDAVFNRAWDQRCRLVTLPAGTVWVHMNGLFSNLHDQDVNTFPLS